jgi:FkbM family methyltransferase
MFAGLGARVIAVEPNDACYGALSKLSRSGRITIEKSAVGSAVGTVELHVCEESWLSTVSEQWYEKTQETPSFVSAQWLHTRKVPVTTLDMLSQRHGIPRFVKIDVEGYEEQVLSGMSFRPDFVSFEFHTSIPDIAARCLGCLQGYAFNMIWGQQPEFVFPTWSSPTDVMRRITSYPGDVVFGDIFARLMP